MYSEGYRAELNVLWNAYMQEDEDYSEKGKGHEKKTPSSTSPIISTNEHHKIVGP